ncbi:riboflavin biosynthesis protein RibF [Eggerthella sp. YY7918]|uniref:riboflavin biosynthesis protein RibF n=1 Tax=Eggerthella sp. (strain YY7918) TaxID=502558 RepID=UPI0002171673|nr:riboflavin biosynthesis protein RibF [Eggerthella sp. YY7918]BAK44433.1 FAD synthase [Eggerthella sp. YY7918]
MAQIFRADESFDHGFFEGTSCAFGVFDGVHLGHRFLLNCACTTAQESGGKSIALTFDIDPDEKFHPERLRKLMTNEERLAMLATTGVDAVVVLPFTSEFAASAPDEFLVQTFDGTTPAFLHVGFDFKFGARAAGTVRDLDAWGVEMGTKVCAHGLKSEEGAPITATRIRLLLADGNLDEANRLLGRRYFMTGVVEPGRGEGADLGFRTANLVVADQLRPLGDGVYAAYAYVDGTCYKAAVNVGVAATFAETATATCEVHLLDFEGDLYGKPIKVEFVKWLRSMKKFDDIDELIATVKGNIDWVRENL